MPLCSYVRLYLLRTAGQVPPATGRCGYVSGQLVVQGRYVLLHPPTSLEQLRPKLSLPKMKYTTPPLAHRHPPAAAYFSALCFGVLSLLFGAPSFGALALKAIASLARFALLARAVGGPLLGFALELRCFGTAESEEAGGGANSEPPALLRFSPELGLRLSAELRFSSGCFSPSRGSCTMPRASSRLPFRRTYVETKAGTAGQPEHICQLAEAGRGWPRLEAALSLVWCWRDVLEGELAEASGRLLST